MRRNDSKEDIFGEDSPETGTATPEQIAQLVEKAVAKAEKKKAGRPAGSGKAKSTAVKVDKAAPANLGSVNIVGKMPDDCYKVAMGRGHCAYSPSKKLRYKLEDGSVIHLGRKEGSTNSAPKTGGSKPKSVDALEQIRKILGVSAGGGKSGTAHLPGLKIEVIGASKPKAKKKAETALAKNDEAAATEAKKKQHETRQLGPYQFTLLKNPVTDFELAGIKVVPAGLGALAAAFVSSATKKIPQVEEMQAGPMKDLAPSAGVLAAAIAAHWYAKKNGHEFAARVASDAAAFGLAFGINALVGKWVDETVDSLAGKLKKTPASTPATTTATPSASATTGGRFAQMNGGAFGKVAPPQLDGYVGRAPGYPQAQLASARGYPQTQLSGGADSAAQMAHLMGGRFNESMGGIDLSGLRD